jgi:pSer/pThr/pTyr-binding forkhead associated (FHA) protein
VRHRGHRRQPPPRIVRPAGNGWTFSDLKSTNGTRVNGIPITERPLNPGDQITLGATVIRFETV